MKHFTYKGTLHFQHHCDGQDQGSGTFLGVRAIKAKYLECISVRAIHCSL